MKLPFIPSQHGWHFPNNISTDFAGIFRTYGLCGGMSLSTFNYYRHGLPIPSLRWEDIPAFAKVATNQGEMISVPTDRPGFAHPVFDFILHSQIATFESPNIPKQIVFPGFDTDENHYKWSINDEFPQIKKAIDEGCFVILGLRSPVAGDLLGHQTLVYGYDDENYTLYMYDSNHPDREITVIGNGQRLQFSGNNQYRSYYLQIMLNPAIRSNYTTYDVFRNAQENFSVRPPYVDPASTGAGVGPEPGIYTIQSKLSGKVLDIDLGFANLGGRDNGALLQQWDIRNSDNQKFKLETIENGYYKITAMHSGKVLDVYGVSDEDGAALQQWDYWGGPNQLFTISPVAGNTYKIVARNSGKVLDVYAFSLDNGAKIKQYGFHGGDNQLWLLNRN
jgi:hypothetical protein